MLVNTFANLCFFHKVSNFFFFFYCNYRCNLCNLLDKMCDFTVKIKQKNQKKPFYEKILTNSLKKYFSDIQLFKVGR